MEERWTLVDGSRLIAESLVQAGADCFVGYPITPASWIYQYASQRFPVALAAPDEITTLQWMSGLSAAGHLPVTSTSFPGLALMVESLNMAYMMELPMVVVLVQRLGPATGTATAGAQGDLRLVTSLISGGYPLPVFAISNWADCWTLPAVAASVAVQARTPVILLTSKEMVMTQRDLDLASLPPLTPIQRRVYSGSAPYKPYEAAEELPVPPFVPVGDARHQVRLTASTHDCRGIIQHTSPEALANTKRLQEKIEALTPALFQLDHQRGAETLVVAYDVTAEAARDAVQSLRQAGIPVSLFVPKTLWPVPALYLEILSGFRRLVVAEENLQGQLAQLLFGVAPQPHLRKVTAVGHMISPEAIAAEVAA
jgi:2-oxoglutarate ferredoxin oxidoreductase subunit alpha